LVAAAAAGVPTAGSGGHDWEELNPTFTTFNLEEAAAAMGDEVDDDLPDLDSSGVVAEFGDEDDDDAVAMLLPGMGDEEKKPLDIKNVLPALASSEQTVAVGKSAPDSPPPANLEPMTIRRKVAIKREAAVTVDETRALISQLQVIWSKIAGNRVEGDITDQFPSLLGQEQYLPLYETLVR
jgi:hypothetical protein